MGANERNCWCGLVWFGGCRCFGVLECSTPVPEIAWTLDFFPLKYLPLCNRPPAQNLWSQEKEIRLESSHLSSEHHLDNQVLDFSLPHPRSTMLVAICLGMEVGWGRVLHFLHFYFCLLISQPWHWDHPRPFPEGPILRGAFWGVIEKETQPDTSWDINSPSVLLQSFQWLALTFSDRFLSFHFHPVYFHTALCCQKCFQNKKQLLLFPFTLLRVPHESLRVFLNHPSRFLIVKPGFSAGFHKHVWVTQVGFFFKWKQAQ